jgi:hypothetical protein
MVSRQDQTLNAALSYLADGEAVFPTWWTDSGGKCACGAPAGKCKPGKHPLTPNGFYDSTTNEQTLRRWLRRWPNCNLASRTEFVPRIDIDQPDVARALREERSLALQTRLVSTPLTDFTSHSGHQSQSIPRSST